MNSTPNGSAALRRAERGAVAVVIATGVVIVVMDWVSTPWNRNIDRAPIMQRIPGTFAHGATCSAAAAVLARGPRWAQRLVPAWFALVLGSAVANWWVPYLLARYPGEVTPKIFAAEYSANTRVLPVWPGHPVVPDVQHTLIHLLLTASLVSSARVRWLARLTREGRL